MYELTSLDIGLTTRCNAGCPLCARTDPSKNKGWSWMKSEELSLEDIKKIAPPEYCSKITKFSLCGSYGDPLVAKDLIPIIQYFYTCSPNASLYIATNGSMKKPVSWWHKLGKLLKGKDVEITFGIDGINQEMHAKYRIHTNLDTIFRNVEILQMYKIRLRWQYIAFEYNKEYIEAAEKMAKEKRFDEFVLITSTRASHTSDFDPPSGQIIATSRGAKYNHFTQAQYDSIDCIAENNREVHITASGIVTPCCYIDDRYFVYRYSKELLEHYQLTEDQVPETNEYAHDIKLLYEGVDLNRFNAIQYGLEKVLQDPWWDEFMKNQKELKIYKCNNICGKLK